VVYVCKRCGRVFTSRRAYIFHILVGIEGGYTRSGHGYRGRYSTRYVRASHGVRKHGKNESLLVKILRAFAQRLSR
jgi:uncharacterized C2H2 Zn-finger protein